MFPFLESRNLLPTRKGGRTVRMVDTIFSIGWFLSKFFFSAFHIYNFIAVCGGRCTISDPASTGAVADLSQS